MTHPIPEAALEQPVAIVGKVGSGKTYAAKGAVEHLLEAGRRVLIIDPTGVWHGLRSRADGRPGFPVVIFGGEHADVPVSADSGKVLGELLGRDDIAQAIVDVSEFTTGERTRFLTALFEELYRGKRVPRHLIMDEADEMAPQNPMPETARLLGIVDKIVRRGRVRGFRPMMITQRPAVLHKNVLSQIGTLVALSLTSPQDRAAIEGWVKGNADAGEAKEVLGSLAKLSRGEGWVWSPAAHVLQRVKFPEIRTEDTSSTPDHDDAEWGPRERAAVDVEGVRTALAALGGPGNENTVSAKIPAARLQEVRRAGFAEGEEIGFDRGHKVGLRIGQDFAVVALQEIRSCIDEILSELPNQQAAPPTDTSPVERIKCDVDSGRKSKVSAPAASSSRLVPAKQKILDALAWFESIGIAAPEREIVAFIAGTTSASSSFANNLGALRTAGCIEYPAPGLIALTSDGRAIAVRPPDALTHDAVMAHVSEKLQPAHRRILKALTGIHPEVRTREDLAHAVEVSPASSSFANNLGRLRSLGLITYPTRGEVRAADILFPGRT